MIIFLDTMNLKFFRNLTLCASLFVAAACSDDYVVGETPVVPEQPAALNEILKQYNADVAVMQALFEGKAEIVDYTQDESGTYRFELSNGKIGTATPHPEEDADIPVFGIDEEGYWTISLGGKNEIVTDFSGTPAAALTKAGMGVFTPRIAIGDDGYWQISMNGVQWKRLSASPAADMTGKTSADFSLYKSVELAEDGQFSLALRNGDAVFTADASVSSSAQAWKKFLMGSDDNVLLDFSYAGYMHGEVAPPDVRIDFANRQTDAKGNPYYKASIIGGAQGSASYKVYNVADYGAVPDDGLSDRPALIKILKDAMGCTEVTTEDNGKTLRYWIGGNNANAVIYFPEGTFVLRGGADNETVETLRLTMGNLVIKGAGADKTTIEMAVENNQTSGDLWSTPNLLEIKNNSGLSKLTDVTGDAAKGSFSVEVASAADVSAGDWVCLSVKNNDADFVAQELAPHEVSNLNSDVAIKKDGVLVNEYHQIASVSGGRLVFKEPIMHEVESKWGWTIQKFPHFENVGVEDLTFLGHAKEDFRHHGSASDDGGFKPINLIRLANSWMRRVDFESVSEAASIVSCANVSAYTINISGNRGHASVRSQASSRVFIGNVKDTSSGKIALDSGGKELGEYLEGAGQYHGCGVSKESMGAVIWNVQWGGDACFESHASQPRATLIDRCTGAFIPWREGGDEVQLPNHLNDLIIWNMNATKTSYDSGWGNKFIWWDNNNRWWKNMPPVIVGFHGASIVFDESPDQVKYIESNGTPVEPQSLYEAQLERRLGYVPAWLSALK